MVCVSYVELATMGATAAADGGFGGDVATVSALPVIASKRRV
jgi:hypothetical protein